MCLYSSVCHALVFQMMFVSFNSNMMGITAGAGTDNLSRVTDFTPDF